MIDAIANFFESVFSPVVNLLGVVLRYFHYDIGLPWWLAIVLLTVVLRTILFPLTVRQVKSMRAMQDLRPEMERIRGQFRNNRQRQQEEMMKLYQERKVNPLGGCLPILVQMPVFIGIFYVIRRFGGYGETAGTEPSFQDGGILWFTNLSVMDPYFLLPIISAVTMFAASWITAKSMDPQQRIIILLLPIIVTFFLWNFPAGLFVYWITSNVMTLGQNYAIYNVFPAWSSAREEKKNTAGKRPETSEQADSPNGQIDSERQAAKVAKRKRRKRKR